MYVFKTRYADMTFEGIPAKGPSLVATAFTIRTNDEEIAKALRTRKDVWEMTTKEAVEEAIAPKRGPGRPKGVRGSRTVAETQGE